MMKRAIIISLCLMLCGCVLQSKAPIFAESDGKLILQPFGNQFATFDRDGGKWKKQADIVKFDAEGNHYLIHDKSGDIHVLFAALKGPWWVMQEQDPDKTYNYLLARIEGKALLLTYLDCKILKTNKSLSDAITFKDDDCTANERMTKDRFVELTKSPEHALLKIEPLP
ncbi:MAG TPA: hypothetical protein VII21_05755 [Aestuariivirga sp.]